MNNKPFYCALGGTIERYSDGWKWRDGQPEPRIRDMMLADVAPNFRCCRRGNVTYVEIPASWRSRRYWPNGRIDTQAAAEIEKLLHEAGERSAIYAEGLAEQLDDHRLSIDGWLVDVAQWDAVMREHCGCWWDKECESEILDRARELGWRC